MFYVMPGCGPLAVPRQTPIQLLPVHMLPYALTIFTGAFLLFQVQPLIGKYILPWFGGGPGVWTTCLLFFQTVLLGGYAYAHFTSTYLKPKQQAILHFVLLGLSVALLPITPSDAWKPHPSGDPTWSILLLLVATIGLPYFVLSSTGPLMQQWFSQTNPGVSPYRLYALSNVGSLLALLSYPFVFEVKFPRHTQANMWSAGLAVFVVFCGFCAWQVWKLGQRVPVVTPPAPAPEPAPLADGAVLSGEATPAVAASSESVENPDISDKLLWIGLPAVASVLLLATTNKLSQEVAVIPFLWVLPLSLYLLTFIICFDHARWYNRGVFSALLVIGGAMIAQMLPLGNEVPIRIQIIGYTATLFVACMVCHGELYRLKPLPRQLTSYFLYISFGGALGGFLVAVVAPAIFDDYRELQIGLWILSYLVAVVCFRHQSRSLAVGAALGTIALALVLPWLSSHYDGGSGLWTELREFFTEKKWYVLVAVAALLVCLIDWRQRSLLRTWQPRMAGLIMVLSMALGVLFMIQWRDRGSVQIINSSRNFYGTLKVFNYYPFDEQDNYHLLLHGATTHGLQFQNPERSMMATTYYPPSSGIGMAINNLPEGARRLGLVGLGTGTLAVYGRAGDHLTIYEINPAVETLARTFFTHIEKTPAKVDVLMGDARLTMENEIAENRSPQYDLLALDAFSSDAIPVHLLTKEAFEIYLKQLKPDGVIAVHISNRYLDLRPVVEKLAEHFGMGVVSISDDKEPEWWIYATTWMLVSKNQAFLNQSVIREAAEPPLALSKPMPLWTDDFTNLYSILK